MSNISLEQANKLDELNRQEWHMQLLMKNREKAIRKIKTELPAGVKLKEYLDFLDAKIQRANENHLM